MPTGGTVASSASGAEIAPATANATAASANLIVAGLAERAGYPIRFLKFLWLAFPLMLLSIVISSGYIWLRYFP